MRSRNMDTHRGDIAVGAVGWLMSRTRLSDGKNTKEKGREERHLCPGRGDGLRKLRSPQKSSFHMHHTLRGKWQVRSSLVPRTSSVPESFRL